MAQITPNTQIDTINILQEANSAIDNDLILLQRGSVSFKLRKSNLILSTSQIADIGDDTVLGNVSGSPAAPIPITIDQTVTNNSDRVASSAAIFNFANVEGLLSTNGWTKLPNGLIMQWGVFDAPSLQSSKTTTFPIPFPNNTFNVVATITNPNELGDDFRDYWVQLVSFTTTTATFYLQNSNKNFGEGQIYWQAFGN